MQAALSPIRSPLSSYVPVRRPVVPAPAGPDAPALGVTRVYARDEEIFEEGGKAALVYRLVTGAVRTCTLLSDGRRQIGAFHLPGDLFGIEAADTHRFAAQALGDATVIAYRRAQVQADGELSGELMRAMMRALAQAQSHLLLLGRKTAVERIAAFLLDLSERLGGERHLDLPMSRADIADYLGLTIETVSRTLTQLERNGIIALPDHRRAIVLRDRPALQHLDA